MASYRIYTLNRAGRIITASDADCINDEAAFTWAATTLGPHASIELWQGTRCVGGLSRNRITPGRPAGVPLAGHQSGHQNDNARPAPAGTR